MSFSTKTKDFPIDIGVMFDTDQWDEQIALIKIRATNMDIWFETIGVPAVHEMERMQFESEGGFGNDASKWAKPYSTRYATRKLQQVGHLKKERLTDRLMNTLIGGGSESDAIIEIEPLKLQMGADLNYAATQQFGRGKIPARPPIPTEISEIVVLELELSAIDFVNFGLMSMPRF